MNRKSIQFLRGAESYDPSTSEEILLNGQPFYSHKTKQLYIGYDQKPIKQLKGTTIGLNLENGEGIDSIIQKYSGEVDATHYGNTSTGESAAVFGEANNNSANRSLISGKMNINDGANSIVGGLFNQNGKKATNSIVVGYSNENNGYASIIGGLQNKNSEEAKYSILGGANIENNAVCSLVVAYGTEDKKVVNNGKGAWIGGDINYVGPNGSCSFVHGYGLESNYPGQKIFGRYNKNKSNTIMEIGWGSSEEDRQNIFEVLMDGRAKVQSAPIEDTDVVRLQDIVYTSVEEIKSVIWG